MKQNLIERTVALKLHAREWRMPVIASKVQKRQAETLIRVGKSATCSSIADVTVARLHWLDDREVV